MTTTDAVNEPDEQGEETLERSEQLIDEARGAAPAALRETADDPGPETSTGEDYPVPGDEDDTAERF